MGVPTCAEEHKEVLYATAVATLDFSFIPKHELGSQTQTGFLVSPGKDEKPEKERQCLCENSFTLNDSRAGEKQQGSEFVIIEEHCSLGQYTEP